MNLFILLQEVSQKRPGSAPDSGVGFWIASQVIVTLIVFVGVYFIFKPVFGKKPEQEEEINESIPNNSKGQSD